MGRVPRNIVANVVGQGWTAAMTLLLVPVYVRVLGVEAYGLVGLYATLQASLQILDLGFSQTTNRQLAHYLAFPGKRREVRDFVRTVEVGYWGVGVAAGAILFGAAPLIARRWITLGSLPVEAAVHSLRLMGLVTALQWPLTLNFLKVLTATVGGGGSIVVLLLVSPTVAAYFVWQAISAGIGATLFAVTVWRSLPSSDGRATFRPRVVLDQWRLAAGMGAIAASAIVLSQLDKIFLSKLLSLEAFGYYTLASVVSSAVPILIAGPVFSAVFPRLTTLVAMNSKAELSLLYHRASQLMTILAASGAGVLAGFSHELMRAWTRSDATAATTAPIVSLLVIGSAANALMSMPYALQLAHGWTGIGIRINLGLMALLVPSLVILTSHFGAPGAAAAWVLLNGAYVGVVGPLTHRRLLRGEGRRWFAGDILPPLVAAAVVVGGARAFLRPSSSAPVLLLQIAGVLVLALTATALAAPLIRRGIVEALPRVRRGG